MRRVVILQKSVPHYRIRFFDLLRDNLAHQGIRLDVVYGDGLPEELSKDDLDRLEWGAFVPNRMLRTPIGAFVWQPVVEQLRGADLVIVEHAAKLAVNYLLHLRRIVGGPRLAYWGHGRNFQEHHDGMETVKRFLARHVDWWFAYNERSVEVVRGFGVVADRITNVQNAIDTRELRRLRTDVSPAVLRKTERELGPTSALCVYAGGLYSHKRIEFLLEAAERIRGSRPDFRLAIIGGGPDRAIVDEAARTQPWVLPLGPMFGEQKVAVFAHSRLQLMPGLVGLGILDSFALGVPLVTTNIDTHSPEIAYLEPGVNGVVTVDDVAMYADTVLRLLDDEEVRSRLVGGALRSAEAYTIEAMVERFAAGVRSAIE